MNEQITLSAFEPPHAEEQSVLNDLLPLLNAAATSMGAGNSEIEIHHGKSYSSVKFRNLVAFRLRLRGKSPYLEIPEESKHLVASAFPADCQKSVAGGFYRIGLKNKSIYNCESILVSILKDTIDRLPKDWDCCSRYLECSNAKKCIHPDPSFALGCGYRKILSSGTIYYGENRNID